MRRLLLLLATIATGAAACAKPRPATFAAPTTDIATARAEIAPLFANMLAAANAHDVDRHLAYYVRSPDLVFMINDEAIRGFDTLRQRQREWWLDGKTDVTYRVDGEPTFTMPGPGVVMQTYVLASRRSAPGGGTREGRIAVTTMWQWFPEGWRIIYAQETAAGAPGSKK